MYVKNSEYDQEIPQSQTADNPLAPRGRAARVRHENAAITLDEVFKEVSTIYIVKERSYY